MVHEQRLIVQIRSLRSRAFLDDSHVQDEPIRQGCSLTPIIEILRKSAVKYGLLPN